MGRITKEAAAHQRQQLEAKWENLMGLVAGRPEAIRKVFRSLVETMESEDLAKIQRHLGRVGRPDAGTIVTMAAMAIEECSLRITEREIENTETEQGGL